MPEGSDLIALMEVRRPAPLRVALSPGCDPGMSQWRNAVEYPAFITAGSLLLEWIQCDQMFQAPAAMIPGIKSFSIKMPLSGCFITAMGNDTQTDG